MTIFKPIACCAMTIALVGLAMAAEQRAETQAPVGGESALPWVGTWAASPQPFMPGNLESYHNQTLRLIVHTSVAGRMLRIKLSNLYGDRPLRIGAARVARRTRAAEIDSSTDRALRFAG